MSLIGTFIKKERRRLKIPQPLFASRAGVGLRFLKELEAGRETVRLDKVDKVLWLLGYQTGPVPLTRKPPADEVSTDQL